MNRDLEILERQLESATNRDVPPNASLDEETTSLREAWLAFGQLLETAQPASAPRLRLPPKSAGRRGWLLAILVGLAASLLVAATIAWSGRRTELAAVLPAPSLGAAAGHGEQAAPAKKSSSPAKKSASPAKKSSSPAKEASSSAGSASALAWDDALDREIVVAGQAVVSADQEWIVVAGACTPLRHGLEEVEKDLENNPL